MTGRPRVAVIDYGIGNLRSAEKAIQRQGGDAFLTTDPAAIAAADAVVLPGVGAFGACMRALREAGLEPAVRTAAASGRPFLGICVGMQMLFDGSEEDPAVAGLGIIPGTVVWIPAGVKRPQMQWNRLVIERDDEPMLTGLGAEPWMYFVHSLHGVPADASDVVASCDYGGRLNVAFRRGSVFATQFHPEKSGEWGLALLTNFVRITASQAAEQRGEG
ncbi:MAG TPA: imidazole glycerol phosphate synthase subunit HisH [Ilumatobacteraceae bacterium]|nr:imidazole glycerol phosphate synthase subunit HisH [Ilumatobacteraceae bacterium]